MLCYRLGTIVIFYRADSGFSLHFYCRLFFGDRGRVLVVFLYVYILIPRHLYCSAVP